MIAQLLRALSALCTPTASSAQATYYSGFLRRQLSEATQAFQKAQSELEKARRYHEMRHDYFAQNPNGKSLWDLMQTESWLAAAQNEFNIWAAEVAALQRLMTKAETALAAGQPPLLPPARQPLAASI